MNLDHLEQLVGPLEKTKQFNEIEDALVSHPPTTTAAKADAAIESLLREVERLRCCGNCRHRDEETRDYYGSYFVCLTEFKPKTNMRHIEVDCEDQCRFTPSRWTRREG